MFDKEDVKVNLIFSFQDKIKPFVNQVAQLFGRKKHLEAIKLLDIWYNTKGDKGAVLIKQATESKPKDGFKNVQKAHWDLFVGAEVSGTPTIFVNGYSLPREYEIKDMPYLIDALKK